MLTDEVTIVAALSQGRFQPICLHSERDNHHITRGSSNLRRNLLHKS
jgi:hypothetical protein